MLNGSRAEAALTKQRRQRGIQITVAITVGLVLGLTSGPTRALRPTQHGHRLASSVQAQALPDMTTARGSFPFVRLNSGDILAAGGVTHAGIYTAGAEVLDPTLSAWTSIESMPTPHRGQAHAVLLASGKVLVAGEHPGRFDPPQAHLYDPATGTWDPTGNSPSLNRHSSKLVELVDGRFLYAGGYSGGGSTPAYSTAELYDPVSNRWSATGSLAEARSIYGAVRLVTGPFAGTTMVCGGLENRTLTAIATCEIYDSMTGTWSAAASMGTGRGGFTLTTLADGRVLAAGGQQPGVSLPNLQSSEIYDPVLNTWSALPPMSERRARHTATLMPSGEVLIVGGSHSSSFDDATSVVEAFDPATNTWSVAGRLNDARSNHSTILLPDGRLLVAGGFGADVENIRASVETFVSSGVIDPTVVPSPTLIPTATAVPTATPGGWAQRPDPMACPQISTSVPADAIQEALRRKGSDPGNFQLCNPSVPFSAANGWRDRLSLRDIGNRYNALFNGLVWKCGCP